METIATSMRTGAQPKAKQTGSLPTCSTSDYRVEDRRNQQNTPSAISGMPATRTSGLDPNSVCLAEQNTTLTLAIALNAPCARVHGHTLPDRVRNSDSQQDMAVRSNVIVRMPVMRNPS